MSRGTAAAIAWAAWGVTLALGITHLVLRASTPTPIASATVVIQTMQPARVSMWLRSGQ